MLLKITEKCSLGCKHCLNNSSNNGKHMDFNTLKLVMNFLEDNDLMNYIIVTGGEPTEHPDFCKFVEYIVNRVERYVKNNYKRDKLLVDGKNFHFITITTNGFWCLKNEDLAKKLINLSSLNVLVSFQVSTDKKYYTKPLLDVSNKLWKQPGFILCEDCVQEINPMGRARNNNLPTNKVASSCFNIRAVTKQLYDRTNKLNMDLTFNNIVKSLESANKFCTPSISIYGNIKLGESDLCPPIANINDGEKEIINNILNFKCTGCNIINKRLPELYRALINEF